VVCAPAGGYLDPDVAVDPAGDVLVVWNPNDLWVRRLTGEGWDDPSTPATAIRPCLAPAWTRAAGSP